MTTSSRVYLVAVMFLTISCVTAVAQTPITVTTDKPSYLDGNIITISGTVTEQLNIPISIIIKDSSQHIVYIAQTNPNPDNTYSTQAVAGGSLWKTAGTYEIDVTYGGKDRTSKTTFDFNPISTQPASPSTENQTNTAPVIPEFGPLSISVFAISILVVIFYAKVRPPFRIQ